VEKKEGGLVSPCSTLHPAAFKIHRMTSALPRTGRLIIVVVLINWTSRLHRCEVTPWGTHLNVVDEKPGESGLIRRLLSKGYNT